MRQGCLSARQNAKAMCAESGRGWRRHSARALRVPCVDRGVVARAGQHGLQDGAQELIEALELDSPEAWDRSAPV
jgi:hypothetical protein